MYDDRIDVANKIITADDIFEILSLMNDKLLHYQKVYQKEKAQNNMLEYNYQTWTFQDCGSKLYFLVDFYDNTTISFDSYGSFISVFNTRLRDIKAIEAVFELDYYASDEYNKRQNYRQKIRMHFRENKAEFDVKISSSDKKIDDVYELIKNKILNAPEKYDNVIKKRGRYYNVVGLAIGFIPAIIITTLLLFVEPVRTIFAASYVLYPICCIIIGFVIGGAVSSSILDKLYENILPEKVQVGYDASAGKRIYKDDIDKFTSTSEILIGSKVNNLKNRNEIMEIYSKYKKFIPYELGIILVLSLIVIIIGKVF